MPNFPEIYFGAISEINKGQIDESRPTENPVKNLLIPKA